MKTFKEYLKISKINKLNNNLLKEESKLSMFLYEDEVAPLDVSGDISDNIQKATTDPSTTTNIVSSMATNVGQYFIYGWMIKRFGGKLVTGVVAKLAAQGILKGGTVAATETIVSSVETGGITIGFWATIWAGLTSAIGLSMIGVGLAIWGFLYLMGDPDMYEIKELWKNGRHQKNPTNSKVKEIYKLVAGGLYASKNAGMYFIGKINKESTSSGKFTIRIMDEKKSTQYVEKYMTEINELGELIIKSPLVTDLFVGDQDSWVGDIEDQYAGYNVSGKSNSEDYTSLKNYVEKYMLENGGDDKNPYKVSVAEEAEGFYDTAFGLNIPGMSTLGYASWMLSEECLNQTNSTYNITTRKWIHEAMRPFWIFNVDNLDASNFGLNEFSKFSKSIIGKDSLLSDVGFLKQLEWGILSEDGKYTTKGTFEDLIKQVGPFITKYLKYNAASNKKVPVTNVTLAFGCFWATFGLMTSIWEGSITYLALMRLIYDTQMGTAEQNVLKVFKIDDEYKAGVKINQRNSKSKGDSTDSGTISVSDEEKIKNADIVINAFKNMNGIEEFRG